MSVSELKKSDASVPDNGRVVRHRLIDRIYHWVMAAAVFALMGTAFMPIFGIKFEWLTIHWVAGGVLAFCVLIHIVRAVIWQDRMSMVIDRTDFANGAKIVKRSFGQKVAAPIKAGKYNGLQKLYHLGVAFFMLAIIGTGLAMLSKIDTPFWKRNPYWLGDSDWGTIYTIHGFGAMFMVSMVMIHVYFALRPDEWHLTRSMFRGWMSGKEYKAHHDPARWPASDSK